MHAAVAVDDAVPLRCGDRRAAEVMILIAHLRGTAPMRGKAVDPLHRTGVDLAQLLFEQLPSTDKVRSSSGPIDQSTTTLSIPIASRFRPREIRDADRAGC
jgi:hypothetical protein